MPNANKYSTGSESLALKKGNLFIGTGDVGKGPTSTTGYYNGITPPSGGYTIYLNKESQGPSIYTPSTDAQLIALTNSIAGASYTTVNECLVYFAGQADKIIFNRNYEPIVTDGLILNLDAGFTPSYPRSGTTWSDLAGSNNGTLTNGPTFNSADGGSIVFDGADDTVNGTMSGSIFTGNFTQTAWIYKLNNTEIWQGVFTNSSPATNNTYLMTFGNGSIEAPFNSIGSNQVGLLPNGIFLDIGSHLNRWLYLAISKTGSLLTIYCFKDGNLLSNSGSITWNGGNFSITSNYQLARHWAGCCSVPFQGNISNVTVYNRALSESEISQNFNAQKGRFGL